MPFITIFLIAISLSMDAFAVSVTAGVSHKQMQLQKAAKIAFVFGLFQMLMPIIGWQAGEELQEAFSQADHWVAFILLSLIGGKMIFDALKPEKNENKKTNILENKVLYALGIATSIDALITGLSFAFLHISLKQAVPIIGLVTFLMSFFGVSLGKKCGHLFENKFEILGGLILMGLGLKILLSHIL